MRNFDAVDQGRIDPFKGRSLALDTVRTQADPLMLPYAGTFLYLDDDTDGKIYIRFNDKDSVRIPIQAGFNTGNILYRRIFLDWSAQSGKVSNIVYGADAIFNPTNDIANIGVVGSISSPILVRSMGGNTPYFRSSSTAGLGTIVAPVLNTAGILISAYTLSALNMQVVRLIHKTSAPSSYSDGIGIGSAQGDNTTMQTRAMATALPYLVPPGHGLYEQPNGAANLTVVDVSYEVL